MKRLSIALMTSAGLILAAASVYAAGSPSSSTSRGAADKLDRAEQKIEAGDYRGAIPLLKDVVEDDSDNADAYNWLGYVYRQLGKYQESKTHYDRALSIDPDHKGALEYLGELYLKLGEPQKAREQLARLDKVCASGCKEYDELKEAIENQK